MTSLLAQGHRMCAGCGDALAVKFALEGVGERCIVVSPTGCIEVSTTPYPESSWNVPWIHSLFDNAGAVAAGIEFGMKRLGKKDDTTVMVIAGDGATFDIGMQAMSGAFERGHDMVYVCVDNEAYMNTGIQRSGATPYDASTTTSPAGKASFGNSRPKKNMPAIIADHGSPYVATTSIAYAKDAIKKVRRAAEIEGPAYIQIHAPCCTGWKFETSKTVEVGRLAVETALWPMYEMVDGRTEKVKKIKNRKPVEEYLRMQGRFKHLFTMEGGEDEIARIQAIANWNAEHFGLE